MQSKKKNKKKLIVSVLVVCLSILMLGLVVLWYIKSETDTKASVENIETIHEKAQTEGEGETEEQQNEVIGDSVVNTPNSQDDVEDDEKTAGVQSNYDFSSIEMKNFKADTYDIYINTDKDVEFTVEIDSEKYREIEGITVCDGDGQFVVSMNDKGVAGDGCDELTTMEQYDLSELHSLTIFNCHNLKELNLSNPSKLTELRVIQCRGLERMEVSGVKEMANMEINCDRLRSLVGIENLGKLERLNIACSELSSLGKITNYQNMKSLCIQCMDMPAMYSVREYTEYIEQLEDPERYENNERY